MTSESTSAKYEWVAGVLRSEIRDGMYAVGSALPPIAELAKRFDISHMTAKQALGVLRAEGLVATGRGAPARVVSLSSEPSVHDQLQAMQDRVAAIERRTAELEGHVFKPTAGES